MISSMTGFGRAQISRDGIDVSVEIKSLNSRFLEINLKLPAIVQPKEFEIKELIRRRISRGKITVTIDFKVNPSVQSPIKVNFDFVGAYVKALRELKRKFKVKGEIKLEHLLSLPNIFDVNSFDISEEQWEILKEGIEKALENLIESRCKEGEQLAEDIEKRVKMISEKVDLIRKLSEENLRERQKKLREKVHEIFSDVEFDRNRLEAELLILADKLDVTEECIRLKSHVNVFLEVMKSDDVAVGKRLNFILQEMLREATTIGAKTDDVEVTYLVVVIKEEIEKIREQLQNVE
jgi:uncharacterized protein (TIGR00255 family)